MLSGLSGALLPVHLQPKDDELLSSWIIRLAHAHGIKVQTMSAMLFGQNTNIWNRDLDQLAPLEDLKILSTVSGAPFDRIEQTTLRSLEGTLFEHHTPNGMCRWIIPIGIFHRSRRRPGLMFCPKCLQDDSEPFFRRTWRLAFATLCTKHHCYLLDTCPNCKSPLAPHRSDMQSRAVFPVAGFNVCCWKCGFDYRNENGLLHSLPEELSVTFQTKLENAVTNGFTRWAGNQNMHSLAYFEGLRALIAGITSKQTLQRLSKSKFLDTTSLVGWPKNGLEIASLSERRALFTVLAEILCEWPEKLVALITECKLRYCDLKGDAEHLPLWYDDVIRHEAGAACIATSHDELQSIIDVVTARQGTFSALKAKKLFGRKLSVPPAQPISDEIYEVVLTTIDKQIEGSLDETAQACLIRDKLMFVAGRIFKLSQDELANFTLEQLRRISPENDDVKGSRVATTPAQMRGQLEWYWNEIRPILQPLDHVRQVFTSSITKRGLRRSAIGLRFREAVTSAGLDQKNVCYGIWKR